MLHLTQVLRERLLRGVVTAAAPSLEALAKTQWDGGFERLMRARMVQGYFRFGDIRDPRRLNAGRNNVDKAIHNLRMYLSTGNQEYLVDAANGCLVEFVAPSQHLAPYFETIHRR